MCNPGALKDASTAALGVRDAELGWVGGEDEESAGVPLTGGEEGVTKVAGGAGSGRVSGSVWSIGSGTGEGLGRALGLGLGKGLVVCTVVGVGCTLGEAGSTGGRGGSGATWGRSAATRVASMICGGEGGGVSMTLRARQAIQRIPCKVIDNNTAVSGKRNRDAWASRAPMVIKLMEKWVDDFRGGG